MRRTMAVEFELLQTFDDPRGSSFDPIEGAALVDHRNVHVVLTASGHVRGNHLHHRGIERLVVRGPALVATEDEDGRVEREIAAGVVARITLGPGVAHAVKNTGEATMLIVSFGTEPFDPKNTSPKKLL